MNRPRPALSSHNGRRLIWERGTRDPRRHKWVARTIAMLIRALTKPRTTEYGRAHLSASRRERRLRSSPASRPINPSVETTKGVKCLHCSRQAGKYFFFFFNATLLYSITKVRGSGIDLRRNAWTLPKLRSGHVLVASCGLLSSFKYPF